MEPGKWKLRYVGSLQPHVDVSAFLPIIFFCYGNVVEVFIVVVAILVVVCNLFEVLLFSYVNTSP
jgi:hypothetical protein